MSKKIMSNGTKNNPEFSLSSQLLKHQSQMLNFLFFTQYDIIYETFQLKHAAYLQKKKGQLTKTFKNEEIGKYYKAMSQKTHIRILRDDVGLDKHLTRLQTLWQYKSVPYFHRYYFMKYIFSAFTRNIQQFINNQQKLIENQHHIYYSITRAINAREACLKQLKKSLGDLNNEDVQEYLRVKQKTQENNKKKQELQKYQIQGYKVDMITDDSIQPQNSKTKFEQFSHLFNHLTKLTLYVIQIITNWKKYIYSLSQDLKKNQDRIQYYFNDDNYFLKILNDNGFIRVSFLANYYNFAPKNDPFLLKTILSFEKQQQKTLWNEYLKQIFLPERQLRTQILCKIECLSQQYKHNIRSRKIYDLNIYKRSTNFRNLQMGNRNKSKSLFSQPPVSNTILKKYQSPTIQRKQKFYKLKQNGAIKKENNQIIIQFGESRIKRNTSLPVIKQKLVVEQQTSALRKSIIVQKNPIKSNNIDKILDSKLLGVLKQEVIKKFKQEFNQEQRKQLHKNQPLEMFIDTKVKQAMKGVFPFEPQKELKLPIQFTTRSISEHELNSDISKMYTKSILQYSEMQIKQNQLIKLIQSCQFLYLIRATIGEEIIGDIICTANSDAQERSLKVLYIGFYDLSQLQLLMVKFVDFLMKYETSNEVVYSFLLPINNKTIQNLLQSLHLSFNNQALYIKKQKYSTVSQIRYIFYRKTKTMLNIPNINPRGFKITIGSLLSQQKLMVESCMRLGENHHNIYYDFLICEMIRNYISSDDFLILKEKVWWTERLKNMLEMIMSIQKENTFGLNVSYIESDNVANLNKILQKNNEFLFEVSDTNKVNKIKYIKLDLSITLPYEVKCVTINNNTSQYFRYSVQSKIQYWAKSTTNFYSFSTNQNHQIICVFFSAKEFLSLDQSDQYLSVYLKKSIKSSQISVRQVQKMWVPMFRFPQKYEERQNTYMSTFKSGDLSSIKKQVIIGQRSEYFCNILMQNGINYEKNKYDLVFEKPFGFAIMTKHNNNVIYSRIII